MISAIAFDLGGVLAAADDTGLLEATGCTEAQLNVGGAVELLEVGGLTFSDFFSVVSPLFRQACSEELFRKAWRSTLVLNPRMLAILQALKAQKLKIAIFTNLDLERVEELRDQLERAKLQEVLICSSGFIGSKKPSIHFFAPAIDLVGVPPKKILFIDDTRAQIEGACAAGLSTYLFRDEDDLAKELIYWCIIV